MGCIGQNKSKRSAVAARNNDAPALGIEAFDLECSESKGKEKRRFSVSGPMAPKQAKPRPELPPDKSGEIVLTARSLFLNQNVSIFDPAHKLPWNEGSYSQQLRLTDDILRTWTGKSVLDIAGGAGFFPEEACVAFGVEQFHVVDLNAEQYRERLRQKVNEGMLKHYGISDDIKTYREYVRHIYQMNLADLQARDAEQNIVPANLRHAFNAVFEARADIAKVIHADDGPVRRTSGDATNLHKIASDSYDVVLNCWMLNYLDDPRRLAVVKEAVRVTRAGGEILFDGGTEGASGSQFTELNTEHAGTFPALNHARFEEWAKKEQIQRSKVDEQRYQISGKLVQVEGDGTFVRLKILE